MQLEQKIDALYCAMEFIKVLVAFLITMWCTHITSGSCT